jgi:hypothetical protein
VPFWPKLIFERLHELQVQLDLAYMRVACHLDVHDNVPVVPNHTGVEISSHPIFNVHDFHFWVVIKHQQHLWEPFWGVENQFSPYLVERKVRWWRNV